MQNTCTYTLCFLDPDGQRCAEREEEEKSPKKLISSLARINISIMQDIRERIDKIDTNASKRLEIMQYDLIPRYYIYIVDDSFMTVQSYAYGCGEDTPTFVLRRREPHGLFEFYASVARHIIEQARPTD